MIHDNLCPIEPNPLATECRTCDLIAKVRENERTRWHGADYSVDWHRGYQQGLADGKGHTCPDNNCCNQSGDI